MPTPLESLSDGSLPPGLNFTSTSLAQRKRDAQDIVSSFHPHVLPSECLPDIYRNITDEQSNRPSVEWTIIADLQGTVMQWAVHDPGCWTFVNRCQPADLRARLFMEKLRRRFRQELIRYDETVNHIEYEPEAPPPSPTYLGSIVADIAERIHSLVVAARLDLDDRPVGQGGTVKVLLETLEAICRRSKNVSPILLEGDRSTTGAEPEISLYDILVRRQPPGTLTLIWEALEKVFDMSPGVLSTMGTQFETIGHILPTINTSLADWQRFRELSAQAGIRI